MPTGVYSHKSIPRKLSEEDVTYIKENVNKRCQSGLARKFGVSRQRIHQIKKSLQGVTVNG